METMDLSVENAEFQHSVDAVFGNSLVVARICSFLPAVSDLRSLRSLSGLFYLETTKRLRVNPRKPLVELTTNESITNFLDTMSTRLEPENIPFPFVMFKLNLRNSLELLQRFATEVGRHVHLLSFEPFLDRWTEEWDFIKAGSKLVVLLSRTPNLQQLHLNTDMQVRLSTRDLMALPVQYPTLRIIEVTHYRDREAASCPPNSVPLLSFLVAWSTYLEQVGIQKIEETPSQMNSIFRLLKERHRTHLPLLTLRTSNYIRPTTVPVLQRMIAMSLPFKVISIELLNPNDQLLTRRLTDADIYFLMRGVTQWLAMQCSTLKQLSLCIWKPYNSLSLSIPPLNVLEELQIKSRTSNLGDFQLVAPLIPNQFPVLRKVSLYGYTDGLNTFDHSSLPSVQELEIASHSGRLTDPWHIYFPNLKILSYRVDWLFSNDDIPNVAFLLTHFPRIRRLTLNFQSGLEGLASNDFWDVLTGGAPRPASQEDLFSGDIYNGELAVELNEAIDGIHEVSSLQNLRALETLCCHPQTRSNLDAILYMSNVGLLVPLKRITILGIGRDFELEMAEKEKYREALAQVHAEVDFGLEIEDLEDQELT